MKNELFHPAYRADSYLFYVKEANYGKGEA